MDVNNAATFLIGTMLITFAFCIIGMAVLFLNNMFSKYWKPVVWRISDVFVEYQPLPVKKNTETAIKDK
jgi:mannitol-specific phosphotransferase system IIBC component